MGTASLAKTANSSTTTKFVKVAVRSKSAETGTQNCASTKVVAEGRKLVLINMKSVHKKKDCKIKLRL